LGIVWCNGNNLIKTLKIGFFFYVDKSKRINILLTDSTHKESQTGVPYKLTYGRPATKWNPTITICGAMKIPYFSLPHL